MTDKKTGRKLRHMDHFTVIKLIALAVAYLALRTALRAAR